jgi:hypothetical protein
MNVAADLVSQSICSWFHSMHTCQTQHQQPSLHGNISLSHCTETMATVRCRCIVSEGILPSRQDIQSSSSTEPHVANAEQLTVGQTLESVGSTSTVREQRLMTNWHIESLTRHEATLTPWKKCVWHLLYKSIELMKLLVLCKYLACFSRILIVSRLIVHPYLRLARSLLAVFPSKNLRPHIKSW